MKNKKLSIDKFRIFAAILVIAIHIYPLSSINQNLDFIFTHIICRIGVPFFLMITGYFVLPKALKDKEQLMKYTKKIIKIYVICIILYLPINIYAGKLDGMTILKALQEILINGTFYHLWYFPALILGIWIVYFIIAKINSKKIWIIFGALYTIGLLGDSYYGLSEGVGIVKSFYDGVFSICKYTRNGLFFAPIFIYLGYNFNNLKLKIGNKTNIALVIVSLILMIIEGIILHKYNLQKHDSMYIMLVPLMIVIFNIVINLKGKENKTLRNMATTIYIIHPLFIIIIRGIAKIVHLENLMIYNSIINYILVATCSIMFSLVLEKVKQMYIKKLERNE